MLVEKVHGYKNSTALVRNVRLMKTFLVNRNIMFTGDDFMPGYCSYYTNSIYKFQVTPELVLLYPSRAKESLLDARTAWCHLIFHKWHLTAESNLSLSGKLKVRCSSKKHFTSSRNLRSQSRKFCANLLLNLPRTSLDCSKKMPLWTSHIKKKSKTVVGMM